MWNSIKKILIPKDDNKCSQCLFNEIGFYTSNCPQCQTKLAIMRQEEQKRLTCIIEEQQNRLRYARISLILEKHDLYLWELNK